MLVWLREAGLALLPAHCMYALWFAKDTREENMKKALVYFDAAEGCDGADVVFARLRKQWSKQLNVYYFKAESNPSFARKYGVAEDVVFALFQNGRMVKRVDAPTFLKPLLGPDNQVTSFESFFDDFQIALEQFANLR